MENKKIKHKCNNCENKYVIIYKEETDSEPEFCPFCTEPLDLELEPLEL